MHHILRLSETTYVGLCHKIGTPTEVRIRREVDNAEEAVRKPIMKSRGFTTLKSGSNREGFRLSTSDEDYMSWEENVKVICDLSQIRYYHVPRQVLILMECDDLPPGFTRLKLISPSNDPIVKASCVVIENEFYIFSTLYRDNHLRLQRLFPGDFRTSTSHGPCSSFIMDNTENDFVFCFHSYHWPTSALPWIQRCREQGWPCEAVLADILNTGFHVVPIGSTPEKGEEWRISFSLAEQKLVHSLNHYWVTQ
ncbi:uncharacterized protein LOC134270072 [Saccostrea cucullata]|uniref:uncharacterized protein LOC134270072 n=1 Tax=Saccostrea cuccullata TaxID=36930 RepID=UPI002ED3479F